MKRPDKQRALIQAARKIRWPAAEVDTLMVDLIIGMPEYYRLDPALRTTFVQMICANTLNSEPYAPPVTVANPVDDEPCPPWEFYYTNDLLYGKNVRRGDPKKLKGCDCVGGCNPNSSTCACLRRQKQYFGLAGMDEDTCKFNYDDNERVVNTSFPVFECNEACGCDEDCMNRVSGAYCFLSSSHALFQVVQRGRQFPIEIMKTRFKGWGTLCEKFICAVAHVMQASSRRPLFLWAHSSASMLAN